MPAIPIHLLPDLSEYSSSFRNAVYQVRNGFWPRVWNNTDSKFKCPCCGKKAVMWRYSIFSVMAAELHFAYRDHGRGFFNTKRTAEGKNSTQQFTNLRYWGLIEERQMTAEEKKDGTKRTTGDWRITDKGIAFINNEIELPHHVFVWQAQIVKFSDDLRNFKACLGKTFKVNELTGDLEKVKIETT